MQRDTYLVVRNRRVHWCGRCVCRRSWWQIACRLSSIHCSRSGYDDNELVTHGCSSISSSKEWGQYSIIPVAGAGAGGAAVVCVVKKQDRLAGLLSLKTNVVVCVKKKQTE